MGRRRWIGVLIRDVLPALLFGFVGLHDVQTSAIGLLPAAAGPPVAWVVGAALLFRRYLPLPVLAATVLGEMLVGTTFPLLLAIFTVADRYGNRRQTWWSALCVLIAGVVPWGLQNIWPEFFNRGIIVTLTIAVPLLLGLWTNQRAATLAALRERAEQAERERDLRTSAAVESERRRIARELHDIVAHRISQITVLAGALEVSAEGKPADIAATIRTTGVTALTEMRELLGVLRDTPAEPANDTEVSGPVVRDTDGSATAAPAGPRRLASTLRQFLGRNLTVGGRPRPLADLDGGALETAAPEQNSGSRADAVPEPGSRSTDDGLGTGASEMSASFGKPSQVIGQARSKSDERVPLRPAPTLAAVAELVADAVEAGQRIEMSAPAALPEVPGAVGRAVYRLIQEALTNAAKHAAGSVVRVELTDRTDGSLAVDVRNGPGDRTAIAAHGSGFGLVGMRERVELAGGTMHSGALPDGGFAVHATFPAGAGDA
ncbi:histidine kinase [Nocardia yamanashiensis]|uniref:sensor histidine kinase n=1 Tax=Nocardia yamanashiensis TaxID=209247 RepID=UPI001E561B9B|nr:sensor histidine kinase [Nocardia yamanashiensis]UGT41612.1 histidine kinase [Nocardia yamanashiensis]